MIKVYISAPYKANTEKEIQENVDRALLCAVALIQAGYSVFVPHLAHYIHTMAKGIGVEISHEKWIELDLTWLKECDAMLVLGISPGVKTEMEFAKEHGIPIVYWLEDLKNLDKMRNGVRGDNCPS